MLVVQENGHVAKRMLYAASTGLDGERRRIPVVREALPSAASGRDRAEPLEKRTRHRRALMRMPFDYTIPISG